MQILYCLLASCLVVPSALAWAPSNTLSSSRNGVASTTALGMKPTMDSTSASGSVSSTRKAFVNSLLAGAMATTAAATVGVWPSFADESLPNGVTYKVLKTGDGPKPEKGELVAIRFKAFAGEQKIDDIFDSPEPYYTRLGSGGLIKGVEETLPLMKLGDRWELSVPVSSVAWLHTTVGCNPPYRLRFSQTVFPSRCFVLPGKPCVWQKGTPCFGWTTSYSW